MRPVLAIATLTIREALRSRLVLLLIVLILAVAFGMPHILKGDGTPASLVRMTISYTLGTTIGLIALASLWTSCGLVAREISRHTLPLVRVKPVLTWQIWLGKWIGQLALILPALVITYLATGVTVFRQLSRDPEVAAGMIHAREIVKPQLLSLQQQLRYILAQSPPTERTPREEREYRRHLRKELPYHSAALSSGQTWNWKFRLKTPPSPDRPMWLRLRFETDAFTRPAIKAQCRLQGVQTNGEIEFILDDFPSRIIEIPLDAAPFQGDTDLNLIITHSGGEDAGPLVIQPRQHIELLVPKMGILSNILRSLLVNLSILGFLAALGTACGTAFSFPVAAFCSSALLVAALVSNFVISDPDALEELADIENPSPLQKITIPLAAGTAQAMTAAARPILSPEPLRQLAAAEIVENQRLRALILQNLLAYPILFCLLSSLALAGKEMHS